MKRRETSNPPVADGGEVSPGGTAVSRTHDASPTISGSEKCDCPGGGKFAWAHDCPKHGHTPNRGIDDREIMVAESVPAPRKRPGTWPEPTKEVGHGSV